MIDATHPMSEAGPAPATEAAPGEAPRGRRLTQRRAASAPSAIRRRLDEVWAGLQGFARREGEAHGKRVELVATGGEIDVDDATGEALRRALADLVRNAVDHGVESPAARVGAGKPPIAILRLSARRSGGDVELTLADDGRGVDPARVRARCVAEGRLTPSEAERLRTAEVQDLIFDPGVTTCRHAVPVTRIRGAGLDRVREAMRAVGGRVALISAPGRGAAFTLTAPEPAVSRRHARSVA